MAFYGLFSPVWHKLRHKTGLIDLYYLIIATDSQALTATNPTQYTTTQNKPS